MISESPTKIKRKNFVKFSCNIEPKTFSLKIFRPNFLENFELANSIQIQDIFSLFFTTMYQEFLSKGEEMIVNQDVDLRNNDLIINKGNISNFINSIKYCYEV